MKGYLFIEHCGEITPAYVEDPKKEFIGIGDRLLIEESDGEIYQAFAVSPIHASYTEDDIDADLRDLRRITGIRKLPRLIGTVLIDNWYGRKEHQDPYEEDEDEE